MSMRSLTRVFNACRNNYICVFAGHHTTPSSEKKGDDLASHFVLAFQWSVSLKPCKNNFARVLYFLNLQFGTTTPSCENKSTD